MSLYKYTCNVYMFLSRNNLLSSIHKINFIDFSCSDDVNQGY